MTTIATEVQRLSPSALVELFVLDLAKYDGPALYFHAGTNELNEDVTWQGQVYTRFPVEAEGFDKRSNGTLPRPILRASNIKGVLAAEARSYFEFMGCKVIRKRTFARFLDAVNFAGGNPEADPNQHYRDDIYFVDRKAKENPSFIEFELAAAFDIQGVALPRRQVIQNCCTWLYRSSQCGYTGGPVADESGEPTSDPARDKCGKRLSDCKLRFGQYAELPFGGFPGVGLIR